MKFALSIEKKNSLNLSQAEGHNARHHATKSQLPQYAWLTPQGHHTLKKWDGAVVDQAKGLAKRKDAVLAVELVIQVGNQTDWRDVPDSACPEGKPKRGNSSKMNALVAGAIQAIERDIGWSRVISAELHTDESSPHIHIVFAPIQDGKLQAKNWVGGAAKCAQLRERIHANIEQHLQCSYTKGGPGGQPHDPEQAAGKSKAPAAGPVAALMAKIQQLEQQVQRLFSQLKAEQKKRREIKEEADNFLLLSVKRDEAAKQKIEALKAKLEELRPTPRPAPKNAPVALVGPLSRLVAAPQHVSGKKGPEGP